MPNDLPTICTAHRRDGTPCKNVPMRGGVVCRMHGGKSPNALMAAARRIAEQKAQQKAMRLVGIERGIASITDPVRVLMDLGGEALAFKDVLSEHVQNLTEMRFEDKKGAEQIRGELQAYERALDRCEKFAHNIAKLDLAERIAKVEAAQAVLAARELDASMAEAGIEPEMRHAVLAILARRLRAFE